MSARPPGPPLATAEGTTVEQALRGEIARLRAQLEEAQKHEADLLAHNTLLRESRLAALNLIEDAVDAGRRANAASAALQRERDLIAHLIASLPGVFYLFDADGHFLRWNRNFEVVSGYSGEEIARLHPTALFRDADRDLIAERIGRVFSHGSADAEAGFVAKDGRSTPFYFTGERVLVDGRPCLIGVGFDVSARVQAEASARLLETQLHEAQKMEAMGTLAGGIAHDFNNILAGMLGNLSFALDGLAPDASATHYLVQVRRAAERARRLVQQILSFSRRSPPLMVAQPLAPLLDETLAMLRATLPAGVALTLHGTETALAARVDSTQFEQVLLNLCTNAWHALEGRGGHIDIGLDAVELDAAAAAALGLTAGSHARLSVRDDGCGMDEATRARIFEPFFTTKPVGSGTGLGLAVAHGIVHAHRGAITVDSGPGRGATFTILLPACEADAPMLPAAPSTATGSAAGGGRCVLVIDDDETMSEVTRQLLERAGYRAVAATSPAQGLAWLDEQRGAFDLVLTDFNMPGASGLDVARAARAMDPTLPVMITSGYIDEELQRQASAAGVSAVLRKERTVEDLVAAVDAVISRR